MEYVVFPLKNSKAKVALLLDYIVAIWSSEDGQSSFVSMNFDAEDTIEVNTPFEDVLAWFDHYTETAEEEEDENGNVRHAVAKPRRGSRGHPDLRMVETEGDGR